MQKPYSIKVKEYRQNLIEITNKAGLPLEQMSPIVNELRQMLDNTIQQNIAKDEAEWSDFLQKNAGKDNTESEVTD